MTTPFTCDQFSDRLRDFLERDVDETVRASLEAHALSCDDCGVLLADLRKLRIDAANLPELAPSRDLWAGIAERIETPVVRLNGGARQAQRRRSRTPLWMGIAATALVAVTATITHEITKRSPSAQAPSQVAVLPTATPAPDTTSKTTVDTTRATPSASRFPLPASRAPQTTLASNRLTPQQTYDHEIARLHAILEARRSTLDTATVHVIEHNLQVIDDAIAQCKAALKKDPASRYLMESLDDALDTKVQLLRTAAMLPSRT